MIAATAEQAGIVSAYAIPLNVGTCKEVRMEKRELRGHVLDLLRTHGDELHNRSALREALHTRDCGFQHYDMLTLSEILWELLMQGILSPGFNPSNEWLPWLHVTERGKAYLSGEGIGPLDPDGYVGRLCESVTQTLDNTLLLYVRESAHAFYANCSIAAAVMLGVASERCIDLLTEAYSNAIGSTTKKADFERDVQQAGRSVKRRFEVLRNKLLSLSLPGELSDALDVLLSGIFHTIRYSRNDAGHPTGATIDQEVVHSSLSVFPTYCKRVYDLIEYLEANTI